MVRDRMSNFKCVFCTRWYYGCHCFKNVFIDLLSLHLGLRILCRHYTYFVQWSVFHLNLSICRQLCLFTNQTMLSIKLIRRKASCVSLTIHRYEYSYEDKIFILSEQITAAGGILVQSRQPYRTLLNKINHIRRRSNFNMNSSGMESQFHWGNFDILPSVLSSMVNSMSQI